MEQDRISMESAGSADGAEADLDRMEMEAFSGLQPLADEPAALPAEAEFPEAAADDAGELDASASEADAFAVPEPEERGSGPWISPSVPLSGAASLSWTPARLLARGERGEGADREPWASFMVMGETAPVELRGREAADLFDAAEARPGEPLDLAFGEDGKPLGARRPLDAVDAERSWIEKPAAKASAPEREVEAARGAVGGEDPYRSPEQVAALGPAEAARMLERSQARAEALLAGARERLFERLWTMERIGEKTDGLGETTREALKGAMGSALAAAGIRDHFNEGNLDLGREGLSGTASIMRGRLKVSALSRDRDVNEVAELAMHRIHHAEERFEKRGERAPSDGVGRGAKEAVQEAGPGGPGREAEEQWFQSRREQWREDNGIAQDPEAGRSDFGSVHGKIADAAARLAVDSLREGNGAYYNALFYNDLEVPGLKLSEKSTGMDAAERRAALMADLLTVARAGQIQEDIRGMERARGELASTGHVSAENAALACSGAKAYDAAGRSEAETLAGLKGGVDASRDLRSLLGKVRGRSEGYSAALDSMEEGMCASVPPTSVSRVSRAIGERAATALAGEFGAEPSLARAPLNSAKPSRSRGLSLQQRLAHGQAGLDRAEALVAAAGLDPAEAERRALAPERAPAKPATAPALGAVAEKLATMRSSGSADSGSGGQDKERERAIKAAREARQAIERSGKGAASEAVQGKPKDEAQGLGR